MANEPLDLAVDGVIATMIVTYGTQKVISAWGGLQREIVAAQWARQLRPYLVESIESAADQMVHRRDEHGQRIGWPPNLAEFLNLVEPIDKAIRRRIRDHESQLPPSRQVEVSSRFTDEQVANAKAKVIELRRRIAEHQAGGGR